MRLKKFKAKGIHGYLSFNLKFHDDINFLTGINGSGKTSVLNSIVALITPDLGKLASIHYDNISLEIANDKSSVEVSAERIVDLVVLRASTIDSALEFRCFTPDPGLPLSRQAEQELEHFREIANNSSDHPVLRLIDSLPNPMFLGLDRRARFEADERRPRPYASSRSMRLGRSVFTAALSRSVSDAADLAETAYRDALISSGRIGERLQNELLLGLLTFSPEDFGPLAVPTPAEVAELERVRADLDALPAIFRISRVEVQRRVVPFLDAMRRSARQVPANTAIDDIMHDRAKPETVRALVAWSANRAQINKIRLISDVVSRYNAERLSSLEPTTRYLSLVNAFLKDSGKSLGFDERGYIHIKIPGSDQVRDISCLSSGEAQIFVILTHLAFNQIAQQANVFIVDEPELSLHVRWQELFVDSMWTANPNIQYIMATHSPSIILEKIDKCIELGQRTRRAIRG